jgi:hypothetical protein
METALMILAFCLTGTICFLCYMGQLLIDAVLDLQHSLEDSMSEVEQECIELHEEIREEVYRKQIGLKG